MGTYDELFVDSPENTRADYEAGVPRRVLPGQQPRAPGALQGDPPSLHARLGREDVHAAGDRPGAVGAAEPDPVRADRREGSAPRARREGAGPGLRLWRDRRAHRGADRGHALRHQPRRVADREGLEEPEPAAANFTVGDFNKPLAFDDDVLRRRLRDPADDLRAATTSSPSPRCSAS